MARTAPEKRRYIPARNVCRRLVRATRGMARTCRFNSAERLSSGIRRPRNSEPLETVSEENKLETTPDGGLSSTELFSDLIEHWERRCVVLDQMVIDAKNIDDQNAVKRLQGKASLARSMTVELKREIRRENAYSPSSMAAITMTKRFWAQVEVTKKIIQERDQYREALNRIARPIWWMQEDAKRDGCKINGAMAANLADSGNYLRAIAEKALFRENNTL